jgi:transaldolase
MLTTGLGPLLQTVTGTATDIWNDSCATEELRWAIEHGSTGATSNPAIVAEVMKKEWDVWSPRVHAITSEHPDRTDVDVTWQIAPSAS